MKSFFFLSFLLGILLFCQGVFAIDFARLESVITGIERDMDLGSEENLLIIVVDEPISDSTDPLERDFPKQGFSERDSSERELSHYHNEAALRPLPSIKKVSKIRRTSDYMDLFFKAEKSILSLLAAEKKLDITGDNEDNDGNEDFGKPSINSCLPDKHKKTVMEPFKNRRRSKRRSRMEKQQQKSEERVSFLNEPLQTSSILNKTANKRADKTADKLENQVFLDRLTCKIRNIVCNEDMP